MKFAIYCALFFLFCVFAMDIFGKAGAILLLIGTVVIIVLGAKKERNK